MTGINAIIFFSNMLFDPDYKIQGIAIINFANFISTLIGMGLLSIAGRKTLMLTLQVFICGSLIGMWQFN